MRKASFQSSFHPAESSLLNSIQRAKQKIFNKPLKTQSTQQNKVNIKNSQINDENNSLRSNILPRQNISFIDQIKQSRKGHINLNQKDSENNIQVVNQNKKQRSTSQLNNSQSNNVAVNAIKVLQQKIQQLQTKNKDLQKKLSQSRIFELSQNSKLQIKNEEVSTIQKPQSDMKSFMILKKQCETLQKQNTSLYEELSKHNQAHQLKKQNKQSGKKLNFHHQSFQNISNVFQTAGQSELEQKNKEYQDKLAAIQQKLNFYKKSFQNQKKNNSTIIQLHQEQIFKNQQLTDQISKLKTKLKETQPVQRKSSRQSNRYSQQRNSQTGVNKVNQVSQGILTRKNAQLQKALAKIKEELKNQQSLLKIKDKQISEIQRKYIQVKQIFIELYKDLTKYHPEVISTHIKFLYDRIRKGQDAMIKSRSLLSHRFGRFSQSKKSGYNALSGFRSKSGKKGLKMQDLNSSKKSQSRQRTNSKNSNKSNSKSNYRSPYGQPNLTNRSKIKTISSPNQKIHYGQSQKNKYKLTQSQRMMIQKIITEIKQISKQIKIIKSEHRNLSVKMGTIQNSDRNSVKGSNQLQDRMNQLIQLYNQKTAKVEALKQQKDRLANQTYQDILL